ncbi:MAG: hypothetical protein HC783_06720 [Rhodobacteraceae bacterium]|nr:hypothetical protein [Paracoccaceae bacterium]
MRLRSDPIEEDVLEEYLGSASDFEFELRILRILTDLGIHCQHGGQYQDPETKKFREFDIRFRHTLAPVTVVAALECKAVSKHFPLLVSTVPRSDHEAYIEAYVFRKRKSPAWGETFITNLNQNVTARRLKSAMIYPAGMPVGKSTAQVGRRDNSDGELLVNDKEFFEKWLQAVQSLDDLVEQIASQDYLEKRSSSDFNIAFPLPIVVVPNGCLWQADFQVDGRRTGKPYRTDRVPIYIGRIYNHNFPHSSLRVSHLEVMTEDGITSFVASYLKDPDRLLSLVQGPKKET